MSLRELLQTDMKTAMKERESGKERLSVLRMVWAAVRNKEIDEKTELTDDAVMAVLMKEVKQREAPTTLCSSSFGKVRAGIR